MSGGALGKKIANLVIIFDNEFGYEFRVQQEVTIPIADGPALSAALAARTPKGLRDAKKLALKHVDRGATAGFKSMMRTAFDHNIQKLVRDQKKASGKKPAAKKSPPKKPPM
jgi:hypothetical protein